MHAQQNILIQCSYSSQGKTPLPINRNTAATNLDN